MVRDDCGGVILLVERTSVNQVPFRAVPEFPQNCLKSVVVVLSNSAISKEIFQTGDY